MALNSFLIFFMFSGTTCNITTHTSRPSLCESFNIFLYLLSNIVPTSLNSKYIKFLLISSCQGSSHVTHIFRREPHPDISSKGSSAYTPLLSYLSSQQQPFIPACYGFVLLFYEVLILYQSEIFIRDYTNFGYISSAREIRLSPLCC